MKETDSQKSAYNPLIAGGILGLLISCVVGMLTGSFLGGGSSPRAFAVVVAISVAIAIIGFWSNGARRFGGTRGLLACVVGALVTSGGVVALGAAMGFPEWILPAFFAAGPVGGIAGAMLGSSKTSSSASSE